MNKTPAKQDQIRYQLTQQLALSSQSLLLQQLFKGQKSKQQLSLALQRQQTLQDQFGSQGQSESDDQQSWQEQQGLSGRGGQRKRMQEDSNGLEAQQPQILEPNGQSIRTPRRQKQLQGNRYQNNFQWEFNIQFKVQPYTNYKNQIDEVSEASIDLGDQPPLANMQEEEFNALLREIYSLPPLTIERLIDVSKGLENFCEKVESIDWLSDFYSKSRLSCFSTYMRIIREWQNTIAPQYFINLFLHFLRILGLKTQMKTYVAGLKKQMMGRKIDDIKRRVITHRNQQQFLRKRQIQKDARKQMKKRYGVAVSSSSQSQSQSDQQDLRQNQIDAHRRCWNKFNGILYYDLEKTKYLDADGKTWIDIPLDQRLRHGEDPLLLEMGITNDYYQKMLQFQQKWKKDQDQIQRQMENQLENLKSKQQHQKDLLGKLQKELKQLQNEKRHFSFKDFSFSFYEEGKPPSPQTFQQKRERQLFQQLTQQQKAHLQRQKERQEMQLFRITCLQYQQKMKRKQAEGLDWYLKQLRKQRVFPSCQKVLGREIEFQNVHAKSYDDMGYYELSMLPDWYLKKTELPDVVKHVQFMRRKYGRARLLRQQPPNKRIRDKYRKDKKNTMKYKRKKEPRRYDPQKVMKVFDWRSLLQE